ncbi:WecB/TagA/CpsF family glycosyltransferase [Propioniciclava soli]|uniref:WecB/TagA/CpsF family glycosyltransferase n=1 Tax=Propioniciclava soli TaxID=2775081 RepID=A0ABZ3C9N6_9ACTN
MNRALSVVIPAHNEAVSIDRCLAALGGTAIGREAEIVVVANGCEDGTAAAARAHAESLPGLIVVETDLASKVHALNLGDEHATAFPRVYLDADIELSPDALPALRDALAGPAPRVAAPRIVFDTAGSSWAVRAFYDIFARLPYATQGLVGLGVYALSESGRRRFGAFPELTSDDLFVQRLFAPHERVSTPGTFTVATPRRWRDLVKVRARIARGNAEFGEAELPGVDTRSSTGGTARALLGLLVRDPRRIVGAVVYAVTRLAAQRRARSGARWERDDSSRTPRTDRVLIDGLPFDKLTEDAVVRRVAAELDAGRGGLIVTPNVDIMARVHADGLADLITSADVVIADGMPLVWSSRIAGDPVPERVAGSDLLWSLSHMAAREQKSVFLLGAAEGVGAEAARRLVRHHPGLKVAGVLSPPLGFEQEEASLIPVVAEVVAARPDIVFVGLGFPKQERVAQVLRRALPDAWFLGCGGAIDMAAGSVSRAHPLLQKVGAEWVHRLVQEPRRLFHRYVVVDTPFALGLLARALTRRRSGAGRPLRAQPATRGAAA